MIDPRETIQQLKPYLPPLEERRTKYRYDFNENILGPSPKAIKALREMDPLLLSVYPEYDEYYRRISTHFGIKSSQLMLSNGTDEAIKLILETYMKAGDEMVLPVPTFTMFQFYAQRIGISVKEVLYNEDLSFPTDRVLKEISPSTRIVVLVNPNNPTGTPIKQDDVERIIQHANHSLVLIDEAYYDFAEDNSLSLLEKYNNIIILRTFSKSIGLAGLRIGMAISNKNIIQILKKSSSPYNVSAIACHLAAAAIEDEEYSDTYVSKVLRSRNVVSEKLSDFGFKVYPSQANFILVDFGLFKNWIIRYLKNEGILVRDRSSYPLLDNCVRITMGDEEDTNRLLKAIKNARDTVPLIFDMDGVLVDVSDSYRKAIAKTTEELTGVLPEMSTIQALKNEGGYNNDWELTHELVQREGKIVSLEEVIEIFQRHYIGDGSQQGVISNERWLLSENILQELYNSHPLYIFTGRPKTEALIALRSNSLDHFFDGLITMDDTPDKKSKPNPWGINQIIKHFTASDSYYFGDSVDDIHAAKSAGIHAIGIKSPESDDMVINALEKAGAEQITTVDKIMEVIQ